jgi:hypothetical protein
MYSANVQVEDIKDEQNPTDFLMLRTQNGYLISIRFFLPERIKGISKKRSNTSSVEESPKRMKLIEIIDSSEEEIIDEEISEEEEQESSKEELPQEESIHDDESEVSTSPCPVLDRGIIKLNPPDSLQIRLSGERSRISILQEDSQNSETHLSQIYEEAAKDLDTTGGKFTFSHMSLAIMILY